MLRPARQGLGGALLEFVHAAGGVHELLLAGVKRVAGVANADDDGRIGGTRLDHVAAGATNFRVHIFRMNVRLHKKGVKTIRKPADDKREFSHAANPLAVFPNGLERSQVARIENVFRRGRRYCPFSNC